MLQWSVSGDGGECELPGGGGGGTRNWQCSSSSFQLTMRNRSWFLSKMDARNFSSALSPDTDIFPSSPAGGVRKGSRGREPPSRPRPPRGAGPGRALAAPPLPAAATRVRARLENGEEREASACVRACGSRTGCCLCNRLHPQEAVAPRLKRATATPPPPPPGRGLPPPRRAPASSVRAPDRPLLS